MKQYIVFRVAKQKFAIEILLTSRIIPFTKITPVPDTAAYIMGVFENEKQVVPVIDLPNRFFNRDIEVSDATQVIIVYWNDQEVGIAVDEVIEIKNIEASDRDGQLEKITSLYEATEATPVKSFIRAEEDIILELNVNDLFNMKGSLQIQELISSYI